MALVAMRAVQEETNRNVQTIADFLKRLWNPERVETPKEAVSTPLTRQTDSNCVLIKGIEQLSVRAGVPHKFVGGEGRGGEGRMKTWIVGSLRWRDCSIR